MRLKVKEWLVPMLRVWAAQRRRVLSGMKALRPSLGDPNPGVHFDGWSSTSPAAAPHEGGFGTDIQQHFPEVYSGDGLIIWRALQGCEYGIWQILHTHWILPGDIDAKIEGLGTGRREYYRMLDEAYIWLAGRVDFIRSAIPEKCAHDSCEENRLSGA
jgi:hypothetical protein